MRNDMKIGYACLVNGVINTGFRTCSKQYATEEKLLELIAYNLQILERIIDYNIENHIQMFRITSDLIPFGSSEINTLNWTEKFSKEFQTIGDKIKINHIRVSMHPGQYTVLNSPDETVVSRAIGDLEYHEKILSALKTDKTNKIILHIGGIYQNKQEAVMRFIENYNKLDIKIKDRLIIENDDKLYTIEDVLNIASKINAPVVFDNLHNQVNKSIAEREECQWIRLCAKTWHIEDGTPKIHYSQQNREKRPGAHSQTIYTDQFMEFYHQIQDNEIDIMLEVKDKNWSAVKCLNLINKRGKIQALEKEWGLYKYLILEHSPKNYQKIRSLLKDKEQYKVVEFYQLIEEALQETVSVGHAVNAFDHVWGYFKNSATQNEKNQFEKKKNDFLNQKIPLNTIKKFLLKLSEKYEEEYLVDSYYFYEVM